MMLSFALALLGPLSPPASAALPAEDQLSLEELLEHYRQRREQLFQELRGELKRTVAELESAYESGRKERLPELRRRLVKLGPEAVPLFLDQLDPGSEAQEAVVGRCRQVALALKELSTKSVSLELIALFKTGSREGQRNALTALSGSDDPERVGPVLREEFTDASKRRRDELISAIANLGGEENFAFIGEILSSNDPDVITSALVALTESRCVAAGPRILGLINETVTAAAHVPEIVAYYRACPEVVDEEHVGDLVRFSKGLRSNTVMSALVLKLVGEHEDHWNSKIKKDLRELSEASSRTLAEAALMCLARAGDRGAKRKLLERYDELVERNERIASRVCARGSGESFQGRSLMLQKPCQRSPHIRLPRTPALTRSTIASYGQLEKRSTPDGSWPIMGSGLGSSSRLTPSCSRSQSTACSTAHPVGFLP